MIPIAKPDIGPEEIEAVTEVLRSGMLAQGKRVAEFEQARTRVRGDLDAVVAGVVDDDLLACTDSEEDFGACR